MATALITVACLAACANRPPAQSQVDIDAVEQPINTPAQAVDLRERHAK